MIRCEYMAEAFAIFGAATGAVGTLNLARQFLQSLIHTVQGYRDAGATLIELSNDFGCFQVRLEVWTRKWRLTESTPEEFYIALWSEIGWRSIAMQLAFIDNRSEDYATLLATIMSFEDLQNIDIESQAADARKIQRSRSHGDAVDGGSRLGCHTRADRTHVERIKGKLAKKNMTLESKAKFVISRATQLSECLDKLKRKFNDLDNDSWNFYADAHPSSALNVSIIDRHETARAKMLMQHALDTRDSSEALYQECLTLNHQVVQDSGLERPAEILRRSEKNLKLPSLEMKLSSREISEVTEVHQQRTTVPRLHYHLLIPWPGSESRLEILVEGLVQADRGQEGDVLNTKPPDCIQSSSIVIQDFKKACALVELRKTCNFQAYLLSDPNVDTSLFRLTPPSEPIQSLTHKPISLSKWLDLVQVTTSAESHERFPLSERLDLAYNIVECGLLLLGTSWLSNLSSKKIQRISVPGREQHRRFLLETEDLTNEDLTPVEPQTFKVGVLLTEIATAQPVLRIRKHGSELHLVMASLLNSSLTPRSLPADKAVERVKNEMGQKYSSAVEFCLQQSQKRKSTAWEEVLKETREWKVRDQAYRAILREYYHEVFLPIEKLRTDVS